MATEPELGHRIQGLKNMREAIVPKIYDESLVDKEIEVSTQVAYERTLMLTRQESIFAGQSSGAVMYAAAKVSEELDSGLIVAVLPDSGFKYLSGPPYYDEEIVRRFLEARGRGVSVRI
ncbi:MAG: hypothetical protein QW092_05745 [Candidatus Korarchaeum sp.]